MKQTPLLDKFEQLPKLREQEESATGKERVKISRKIEALRKKEPSIESLLEALDRQRVARDDLDLTMDIRQIDPVNRTEHMSSLHHSIVNFAQRAFSLPIDYRITNAEWESRGDDPGIVESIVIQPEYISDDFMIGLGFMTESERRLPFSEKIEKKIQAIPHIKTLLRDLTPLTTRTSRSTGRISTVTNPWNPNFGKYIVFQEITNVEEEDSRKRRRMTRKIIPHVYDDTYSMLRWQQHALDSLKRKIEFLSEIRDDLIPALIIRWQRPWYTEDEKKNDLAILEELLQKKLSYNERRALEDRIRKIQLDHPERDRLRLVGACNDLIKETQKKIEKNAEISRQLAWIRNQEKALRISFDHFYDEIIGAIEELNAVMTWSDPRTLREDEPLEGIQTNKLNQFWKIVENFMWLPHFQITLWHPFHTIRGTIAWKAIDMKNHRNGWKKTVRKEWLKITLSLILSLKEIRYHMIQEEVEHHMRVRPHMTLWEKRKLRAKVTKTRISLEQIRFLPEVELLEWWRTKFLAMITDLRAKEALLSPS